MAHRNLLWAKFVEKWAAAAAVATVLCPPPPSSSANVHFAPHDACDDSHGVAWHTKEKKNCQRRWAALSWHIQRGKKSRGKNGLSRYCVPSCLVVNKYFVVAEMSFILQKVCPFTRFTYQRSTSPHLLPLLAAVLLSTLEWFWCERVRPQQQRSKSHWARRWWAAIDNLVERAGGANGIFLLQMLWTKNQYYAMEWG